jgi:hypothetical protein
MARQAAIMRCPDLFLIEINVGVLVRLDYATTTWLLVEIKPNFNAPSLGSTEPVLIDHWDGVC